MFLVPLLVCSTGRDETPKVAMDDGSGKMLRSCHLEIAEGASGVIERWFDIERMGRIPPDCYTVILLSLLSLSWARCCWVVKSLFLSYGMYLVCPLSGVFVWGLISMNHCWIGRVNVANSPSADVVCPQDPHPSRAHPTEWEVKKGLYIYPKWSMYLPMIFLDNSSTISISYTVYKYMQYILYIQYIYTQYIYVYRIMYTYFYIPLLCLIAACRVKTNQGPQIHLRLVACGFSMSFCDLLFVFQKIVCLVVFGIWSIYVYNMYIYIYFIVKFFLILCT